MGALIAHTYTFTTILILLTNIQPSLTNCFKEPDANGHLILTDADVAGWDIWRLDVSSYSDRVNAPYYECNCNNRLTNVTIQTSIVGSRAFYKCTISFLGANELTTIGSAAFYECTSLTTVILPNRICTDRATIISSSAFQNTPLHNVDCISCAPTNLTRPTITIASSTTITITIASSTITIIITRTTTTFTRPI